MTDIASGYGSTTLYNANNALIEAALENTLSLDGTTPNAMTASLDMNSQNIINVPSPNDSLHVANKAYVDSLLAGTTDTGSAQLRVDLADTANTKGASMIGLEDVAAKYTATNVEAALAELSATTGAGVIGLLDSAGYYDGATAEAALAELKPVGLGNLKGFADAAGTVDAMTVDYTPNISWTDGVLFAVKAVGQITSTVPTIAADGLAAKTIVKGDNIALVLSDIISSSQTLLLQYDDTLDKVILLNPNIVSPGEVTDFVSGRMYIDNAAADPSTLSIASTLTVGTWESIGPTGSGAANIWTEMDTIPANAVAIIIKGFCQTSGATNADQYAAIMYGRRTGSSRGANTTSLVGTTRLTNRSGSSELAETAMYAVIPLDSSRRFDARWFQIGTTPTTTITLDMQGWVI